MKVIHSIQQIRTLVRQAKSERKKIGFVPTMGALHEGHLALLRQSKKENDLTVLSIFVNPQQFSANEDFGRYPREEKKDELLAKKENVDIIFRPSIENIFPDEYLTAVKVEKFSQVLCGKFRPGHSKGVTTIVAKLLNIVSPDILYLGQKDAQQAVIISQMITDLNFPVRVKIHPTIREKDGLALSSRNFYLNEKDRLVAPVLFQALTLAKNKILAGEREAKRIIALIQSLIQEKGISRIDYIECVDAKTLEPLTTLRGRIMVSLAVWLGQTRLSDNILVQIK